MIDTILLQIQSDNFGIFTYTMAIISAICATLWAIKAKVFGGNKKWWKGSDEFYVKTGPKIGLILSVIGFASMYLLTTASNFKFYLIVGAILAIITLIFFLSYSYLLELYVLKKYKTIESNGEVQSVLTDVICGKDYTPLAVNYKKENPHDSDEDMLQVSNNEKHYWTRHSIAANRVKIVALLILLQVTGALTVAQAGLVVQVVTTGRPPFQTSKEMIENGDKPAVPGNNKPEGSLQ